MPPRIRCLAPALLGPVPPTLADATASAGPFPALEFLLGKARHRSGGWADGETMIRALATQTPPPGALLARGLAAPPGHRGYRAAPVHLRPDRDRLLLFAGDVLRLSDDEAASICADFNRLFGTDGLTLESRAGEWLLLAEQAPGPELPSLRAVAGQYLDTVIPDDTASRPWRQLLNEAQMFLFDHPVNTAREARGDLPANGLWFWGGGEADTVSTGAGADWIIADEPFARAVGAALDIPVTAPGEVTRADLADATHVVIVWTDAERALLGGDVEGWLAALQRFEGLWAPCLRDLALADGRRVALCTGAGGDFDLGPGARRRFWRRSRPLDRWVTRE